MTISNDLFLAILSMDSYNRGYGAGIAALGGEGTGIGNATVLKDSSQLLSEGADSAAGFHAISYTWNGQTVISYRGTDNYSSLANANGASDILNGWTAGAAQTNSQTGLAIWFYSAVTGNTILEGPSANTLLTGHSLGGGTHSWHQKTILEVEGP